MINLRSLILGSALVAAIGTSAAFSYTPTYAPANRSSPGAKAAPDYTNSGQGLGTAILGAHIAFDASIINGIGTTGAHHVGSGYYEVDFNRDVSKCIYSAVSNVSAGLSVLAQPKFMNVNGVFVQFNKVSTEAVDNDFYLTVFCNQ